MSQIIVGMDESEGAAAALRWAVREGQLRGWPVTAILAYSYLDQHHLVVSEDFDPGYNHAAAIEALHGAVVRTVGEEAAVHVRERAVCDLPDDTLVDSSEHADMLVVGARGRGGFTGLLVGAVSSRCVQRAHCPVVVVRDRTSRPAGTVERIVVGVDGSDGSRAALAWALDTARVHRAEVEIVHAWQSPALAGAFVGAGFDPGLIADAAQHALDAIVDNADTHDVVVKRHLICGGAAPALLETAADADLVVVGSRGFGRVKSLLLGSVSQHVVHHAPCPVVVVPAHD